ncbi:hypothetical protein LX64_00785 [Chitinophaga skermanii]|uniref:Uncharacterized protein n=1 Tax=Chitinophaga skermanii TaxID=331697 RepID=A0A327RB68_9BACT|nr:hypothetical protein [Chitinophaga skermanii]RAJ11177.1 hypothetical protein LX64_00785 [Chitinophaga skermanii]
MKKLLVILFITVSCAAQAQKLPNTQSVPIWANNLKVDGNIEDWGELKSFNKDGNFWYSIANDNEFIYLAIKKTYNITKAISRTGIQFYISKNGEKNIASAPLVQFPVVVANNKRIPMGQWNEIAVKDIPAISDSVISIYNEFGIKVGWEFSFEKSLYVYELRVPRKLLDIDANTSKFTYNICMMGTGQRGRTSIFLTPGLKMISANGSEMTEEDKQKRVDADTVSEFWAEYTIAKKEV